MKKTSLIRMVFELDLLVVAEPVAFDLYLEGHRRHGDDLGSLVASRGRSLQNPSRRLAST
jgi:hypothetical protein